MTQETSRIAYDKIKISGLLSRLQIVVYRALYRYDMTQAECSHFLGISNKAIVSPRFAELKKLGLIIEKEKRPCRLTGKKCIVWCITNDMPVTPLGRVSTKKIILELKKRICELEIELAKYKQAPSQAFLFRLPVYVKP